MSYNFFQAQATDPGLPFWQMAPIPGWDSNPATVGPSRVGVGCPCVGVGEELFDPNQNTNVGPPLPDTEKKSNALLWGLGAVGLLGALYWFSKRRR